MHSFPGYSLNNVDRAIIQIQEAMGPGYDGSNAPPELIAAVVLSDALHALAQAMRQDGHHEWIVARYHHCALDRGNDCRYNYRSKDTYPMTNTSGFTVTALRRVQSRINIRLNDHLCAMREGYDDSIVGFNEAWDIVRTILTDEIQDVEAAQ